MIIKRNINYWPAGEGQERCLHIYLPDDYEWSTEWYPVMYMFDGHNLFSDQDATYGKSWGFNEFLSQWSKKMILVGMECSHEGYSRLSEYSPYSQKMFGHEINGIGEQTFQWIIDTVKPMIDRDYRTYSHREATAIGGSSMGGLMSLYGVIAHNDVFSKAACLSTGVSFHEKNLTKTLLHASILADTKVYLSWGEQEMGGPGESQEKLEHEKSEAGSVHRLSGHLSEFGADTSVFWMKNGRHCEADWETQVPRFMDYLWMNRKW